MSVVIVDGERNDRTDELSFTDPFTIELLRGVRGPLYSVMISESHVVATTAGAPTWPERGLKGPDLMSGLCLCNDLFY